ncbi:MAG: DEAD/DEAH box helicase [Ignavibacteriae bacterium]|nr:DEAD/DEAH box helicase [Ignavibacteriota bacterium]NOG98034.1 DEAD/DEAH box helicase [Ignavibacteriota bacterium]
MYIVTLIFNDNKKKFTLLKNIKSKIKSIFGAKPKKNTLPAKTIKKEQKPAAETAEKKPVPKKKNYNRKPRRKETPEEYRARHENRKQSQQEKTSTEKTSSPKAVVSEPWDSSVFKVPVKDGKTRFHDLDFPVEILRAIYDLKFEYCTEVQAETLPKALVGDDVTAQAQTGTGKTAAFLITIFNHILKNPIKDKRKHGTPRALILAPTRELVLQIEKDARELGKYVPCNILSLLGGIDYGKQQNILKREAIDILICTPGRLIDFMNKRIVDLRKIEILVIDEADRMLDMGFIPDVKKIVYATPQKAKRQTMFFTATLSGDVKRLAESWTRQAFEVVIKPDEVAVDTVEQITYITTVDEKFTLLYNIISKNNLERVLIFVNRRDEAKKLIDKLEMHGISCALLTGDVEQKKRISRLERFRNGKVRILVATDVASRGIHVEAISHVINYNLPQDSEEYVHRIGRTGRAGASGISISFADEEESHNLITLEEFLGKKVECIFPEENLLEPIPEGVKQKRKPRPKSYPKKKYYPKKNTRPRGKK